MFRWKHWIWKNQLCVDYKWDGTDSLYAGATSYLFGCIEAVCDIEKIDFIAFVYWQCLCCSVWVTVMVVKKPLARHLRDLTSPYLGYYYYNYYYNKNNNNYYYY